MVGRAWACERSDKPHWASGDREDAMSGGERNNLKF